MPLCQASMGPPIFIGGNKRRARDAFPYVASFNGAADFHRRKCNKQCFTHLNKVSFNGAADFHRRKYQQSIYARRSLYGFNGAADFHRRKLKSAKRCEGQKDSFNGAADFHRRKCLYIAILRPSPPASMGPPIFIGGNGTSPRARSFT